MCVVQKNFTQNSVILEAVFNMMVKVAENQIEKVFNTDTADGNLLEMLFISSFDKCFHLFSHRFDSSISE